MDTEENCSFHMDAHVIKFPMELQSILIHACAKQRIKYPTLRQWGGTPIIPNGKLLQNPFVKWAALDEANFAFVKQLGLQLCAEYQLRFGQVHNYFSNLLLFPEFLSRDQPMWSRFPVAIPAAFKHPDKSIIENYRHYYIECKNHLAVWSAPRMRPSWFPKEAQDEGRKIAMAYKMARQRKEPIDGLRLTNEDIPQS